MLIIQDFPIYSKDFHIVGACCCDDDLVCRIAMKLPWKLSRCHGNLRACLGFGFWAARGSFCASVTRFVGP